MSQSQFLLPGRHFGVSHADPRSYSIIPVNSQGLTSHHARTEGTFWMQGTWSRPKLSSAANGTSVVGHTGTRLMGDLADPARLTGTFADGLYPPDCAAATPVTTPAGSQSTWR